MNLLVVGAGIGGLTAALRLAQLGHAVTIVERAPELTAVGAGIVLAPNATGILRALGVDLRDGHPLPTMDGLTRSGVRLSSMDPVQVGLGPILGFARPELHEALRAALPAPVTLRLGVEVQALAAGPDRVEVDGVAYDLVVGADGLRSGVRRAVHGDLPLRYSGVTCWRDVVPNPGVSTCTEAWGGATRVGVVPLSRDRVYTFLVRTAPQGAPGPASLEELRAWFGPWSGDAGRLLASLPRVPPLHHDLLELDAPVWGRGRVVLLGDAAHAMTPNLGQGAAMAIEDAYTLGSCLADPANTAEALATARHARVRKVQLDSRRFGGVAHWENPLACGLRDLLMRATPASVVTRSFVQLVTPGVGLVAGQGP